MTAYGDYAAECIRSQGQHPEWRRGQVFFNVLSELHPHLAHEVRGSLRDPFNDDGRIPKFLDWLHGQIGGAS